MRQVETHANAINEINYVMRQFVQAEEALADSVRRIEHNAKRREHFHRAAHAVSVFSEHIDATINALQQLFLNKLHPEFVDLKAISAEFQKLTKVLQPMNMRFFNPSPASIYHYPISAYRLGNQVRYILHVPISTHMEPLNILEYIPTPFNLGNFTAQIHTQDTILIMDDHRTFGTQVSKEYLDGCLHSEGKFHCIGDNVYTKDVKHLCLAHLYSQEMDDIDEVCDVRLTERKETIQRLSSNSFRILASTPQILNMVCQGSDRNRPPN